METMTISEVSRNFDVSTRMLRYYEKVGLISSCRKEDYTNPSDFRKHYGYEDWVTIPDNMEVPEPLVKKKFKGGLYAAHTIEFPNFQEWGLCCGNLKSMGLA